MNKPYSKIKIIHSLVDKPKCIYVFFHPYLKQISLVQAYRKDNKLFKDMYCFGVWKIKPKKNGK